MRYSSDNNKNNKNWLTENCNIICYIILRDFKVKNPDPIYAKSFINNMFKVGKLFGFRTVWFTSNNNKVKVPLVLAALTLPATILMHLEYKVRLPDHNIVVGTPHNLIRSVYGVCDINLKGEVTYLGDTFIRICSGKHDKSSANTHLVICMNTSSLQKLCASQSYWWRSMVHKMRLPDTQIP